MAPRLPTGQMPFRRRHEGLTPMDIRREAQSWELIGHLFHFMMAMAPGAFQNLVVLTVAMMIVTTISIREYIMEAVDPVNPANKNRGIDSFSDDECWKHFRFKKADVRRLFELMDFPEVIESHTTRSTGEAAFCLMLWRLHYPSTWSLLQSTFGREYSQLSRIFNAAIDFVDGRHQGKVKGNIDWYSDRFDMYNDRIKRKIASFGAHINPNPGFVPANMSKIFGFIDGTANRICRPSGNNNLQNSFYNRYHRGHFIIWQGISFPDGMLVVDGPEPGFKTDTMVWRDCMVRHELEAIMQARVARGLNRLFLYADKIYSTGELIKAAFSRRQGNLQDWMVRENRIMSGVRIGVEWTFGLVIGQSKYISFAKGQQLQKVSVPKFYYVAVLLSNAHTCMYGTLHTKYFDCEPPTVDEYFAQ